MLTFQLSEYRVHALAFSPDSVRLAVSAGRRLTVVDWRSPGEPVWREAPQNAAGCAKLLTFDPDGVGIVARYNFRGIHHIGPTTSEFRPRPTFDLLGMTWSPLRLAVVVQSNAPRHVIQLVADTAHPPSSMLLVLRYETGSAVAYLSKGVTRSPLLGFDYLPQTAWVDRWGRLVVRSDKLLRWYSWPTCAGATEHGQLSRGAQVPMRNIRPPKSKVLTEVSFPFPNPDDPVAPLPDGDTLLVASKGAMIRWHAPTSTELSRCRWPGMQALRSLAVSPDGTVAAVGANGGRVMVWDLDV